MKDNNIEFNPFRVIPCLQVDKGRLVKTSKYKKPVYVGDLINNLRIFNEKQVDELVVSDITATRDGREPDFGLIHEMASECFMPLAYGGGIKTVKQIEKIVKLGVEKVILNTAALENPEFITDAAGSVGSQSVVVSIDVKKRLLRNGYDVFTRSGTKKLSTSLDSIVIKVADAGAGEILLNFIDHEGLMCGYDQQLIKMVSKSTSLPLIASGGASGAEDLVKAVTVSGASAAAAGALFIYRGPHRAVLINYPEARVLHSFL